MSDDRATLDSRATSASLDYDGAPFAIPDPPTASPAGCLMLEEIGRGGMGVVYRARDLALDREIAIKVLTNAFVPGSSVAARFVQEARITGQLQHPGIPAVHQTGTLPDGRPYLAMKLIRGRTLEALLKDRTDAAPDHGRFLAVFESVCQAVGYAHAHGVIHRDLKPANIMVGAFGEVQVMDWGLAKELRNSERGMRTSDGDASEAEDRNSDFTASGSVLGTLAYMPPEQATGAVERVDARSDVFGLGAILCVILTGRPPYVATATETTRQLAVRADLAGAFLRLDERTADPELVALCKRCMSVEPADRPVDAGAVADAVARMRAAAADRARQAELDMRAAVVRSAEERKRRRLAMIAAGIVMAVMMTGAGAALWQARRADRARIDAVTEAGNARTAEEKERIARGEADRQKDQAVRQEKAATTTKDFLKSVLLLSGAQKQLAVAGQANHDLTLREALVLAAKLIDGRFADQPLIEAELRATIGSALEQVGAYTEAEPFVRAALALYERELGPDHLRTLDCAHSLAVMDHHLGRIDSALPLFERIARGRERQLGPDHWSTLAAQCQLGFALTACRRLDEAEPLLVRVRDASERVTGRDSYVALFATYSLGLVHHNRGWFDRAEPCFRRSAEGFGKLLAPDHPHALESVSLLGHGYLRRGMMDEARPLLERASRTRDRILGPKHPDALASAIYLAFYYDETARGTDADPLWLRVYADRDRLPEWALNTWMPHWAQVRVGSQRAAEKKYEEAERMMLDGYRALVTKSPSPSAVLGSIDFLVALYADTDRPAEAARWRTEREKACAAHRELAPAPRTKK
jgi:eukaryotic-like serine/threonine-protein kinase